MKDSEFIALLNLYLDREISAADAARLEAEVQSNPDRRRLYREYCEMQKACQLLAADFRNEPAESADGKVVAFEQTAAIRARARSARTGNWYAAGAAVAAAACVAIVFVGQSRKLVPAEAPVAVFASAEVKPAAAAVAAPAAASLRSGPTVLGGANKRNATFMADPLLLAVQRLPDAAGVAVSETGNAQFAWMNQIQLAPVQRPIPVADLRFEARPASLRPEGRPLGPRPAQADVESTAFQFVK